ncbi:hypothetical protein [Streptomyces sp. NRRL S-646]|uniref:hypothetical protein n=1 Tax=Streptomyces sp. NRRL S-646 TaxID=1463917 RepID=UPI001331BD1F|nr:hypothetical protein [Streptomyces sp. NRRL S-646]
MESRHLSPASAAAPATGCARRAPAGGADTGDVRTSPNSSGRRELSVSAATWIGTASASASSSSVASRRSASTRSSPSAPSATRAARRSAAADTTGLTLFATVRRADEPE